MWKSDVYRWGQLCQVNCRGLEPSGSCSPHADCLFLLFSSWVIVTALITRGKHTGEKTYNQRSTLGKTIWNILRRAFGMYSVKANIGAVLFLPPRHILGSLLQHSHNFIFLFTKTPKNINSFLIEILRGNKRQSYFGITVLWSLTARHFLVSPVDVFGQFSVWVAAVLVTFLCSIAALGQEWPQ